MQELLGVDQPDFGPVLDTMVVPAGEPVERSRFIQPKIEAELALHLGRDLVGPGVTRSQAADAVAGVSVAVEVIDSRIEDWKIGLTDTVADLASAGAVVVSPTVVPLTEVTSPVARATVGLCGGGVPAGGAGAGPRSGWKRYALCVTGSTAIVFAPANVATVATTVYLSGES